MSLKTTVAGALVGVALILGAAGSAPAATPPPHDGHAGGTLELSLNQGRKWETDEALRQGMTVIREAMVRSLGAIHVGTFTTTQYASLTRTLEDQVDGIPRPMPNCTSYWRKSLKGSTG
jgi:hypothetical protein